MGPTLSGVTKLLRTPSVSGHSTMTTYATNVAVLEYLVEHSVNDEDAIHKAKGLVEQGRYSCSIILTKKIK